MRSPPAPRSRRCRRHEPDEVEAISAEDRLACDRAEREAAPETYGVDAERLSPAVDRGEVGDDRPRADEDEGLSDACRHPEGDQRGECFCGRVPGDCDRHRERPGDDEDPAPRRSPRRPANGCATSAIGLDIPTASPTPMSPTSSGPGRTAGARAGAFRSRGTRKTKRRSRGRTAPSRFDRCGSRGNRIRSARDETFRVHVMCRRDQPRGAPARGAQPRDAARGAPLPDHPGRAPLPADPLRHPRRRPGRLAARGRRARRAAAVALARRAAGAAGGRARGDDGVRRQRRARARAARRSASRGCSRRSARRAGRGTPLGRTPRGGRRLDDGAVEVVFTGLDRGVEGGVEQAYERSLPSPRRSRATRCWPTRSTACRSRRSTASRCGWSSPAGTG